MIVTYELLFHPRPMAKYLERQVSESPFTNLYQFVVSAFLFLCELRFGKGKKYQTAEQSDVGGCHLLTGKNYSGVYGSYLTLFVTIHVHA